MCLVKKGVHSNMNKIFKVVWSKTKECYVVVSEVAKNNGGKKKALASVLAGLAMVGAGAVGTGVQAADSNSATTMNSSQQINVWATTPETNATNRQPGSGTANANDVRPSQYGDEISIAVGAKNVVKSTDTSNQGGGSSVALGNKNTLKGNRNVAVGTGNKTYGEDSIAVGSNVTVATGRGIAIGNDYNNTHTIAYGSGEPNETGLTGNAFALAIGNGAQADGRANSASGGIAIGQNVKATHNNTIAVGVGTNATGSNSTVVGSSASASGASSAAYGTQSDAKGVGAAAIGPAAKTDGDGATALGRASSAKAESATALGRNAEATIVGGVALGFDSKTTVAAGVQGYNPASDRTNKYSTQAGAVGTSTLAAVSIGEDSTKTRQLTGLAAGTADTDAVNVAQLKNVNLKYAGDSGNSDVLLKDGTLKVKGDTKLISTSADATGITVTAKVGDNITTNTDGKAVAPTTNGIATTDNVTQAINNSGWKVTSANNGGTTNGTTSEKVSPGDTVTLSAGKNIVLDQAGKQFTYSLNKDVDLTNGGSLTIGDTKINNGGMTITGGPSVTKTGINAGNKKITNVAPGTDDTDAVNYSQIKDLRTEVKAGTGVSVAKTQGTDGHDIYTVSANGATGNTDPSKVAAGKNTTVTGDGKAATPYTVNVEGDLTDISSITNGNGSGKISFAGDQVVKVDGDHAISLDGKGGYVTGLQNKDWNITNPTVVSGRAATEDQLKKVSDGFNNTVKLAGNTGNTDTQKLSQDGGLSFGVVGANNGQYIKTTASGTDVVADLSDDAKAKLNHKVEVQGVGTNVHVTEDTTQAGKTIYKVAVDAATPAGASSTESVVKKAAAAGDTNMADIAVENGKNSGEPDAQYSVNVSKNAVKDAAREAVTVNNGGNTDSPITVTPTKDETSHNTTYAVTFDGTKAAKVIPLTYKANGANNQTVTLEKGLNFTNGSNTTASVDADGVVKYDLNKDVDLTKNGSLTIGDTKVNNDGVTITGGPSVTKTGIDAGNKTITNVAPAVNGTDAVNYNQLKAARTVVTSSDGSVTVTPGTNGDALTYDLKVNNTGGTTASTWNIKSSADTANGGATATGHEAAAKTIENTKTVEMIAGKNLTVKQTSDTDGAKVEYALSKDLKDLTSVTTEKVTTKEITLKDPSGPSETVIKKDGDRITYTNDGGNTTKTISTLEDEKHITQGEYTVGDKTIDPNAADDEVTMTYTDGKGAVVNDANGDPITTKIKGIAKSDLSNITPAGKKVITGLGSIVKGGENVNVTEASDATTGQKTYTVNAVTPAVYTKADGTKVYKIVDPTTSAVTYNTKPDGTGTAVPANDVIVSFEDSNGNTTGGNTIINNVGSAIDKTGTATGDTFLTKLGDAANATPNAAVNVKDLKSTSDAIIGKELHIAPTAVKAGSTEVKGGVVDGTENVYKYDAATKKVTLTYNDGNGKAVTDTKAVIDFSDLNIPAASTPYSFKTNATGNLEDGSNAAETEVASGKTVNFGAGKNLTVKQEIGTDGNQTYTYALNKDLTNLDKVVVNGKDGQPGKDGVTITGPSGTAGQDGNNGKVGISGKDGKDAVSISGKDGVGHIGLTGPAGKDGKNATADITVKDGVPGVDGQPGETMTRIVYQDKDGNEHQVATHDDGMKFAGDDGQTDPTKVIKKHLNNVVDIVGGADKAKLTDNNIGVNNDNGKLKVQLSKDLDLTKDGSVKIGDTKIDNDGMTITGGPSVKKDGINAGDKKITGVKAGEDDTDAVNVKQLKDNATTVTSSDNSISVTDTNTDPAKGHAYDIKINNQGVVNNAQIPVVYTKQDGTKVYKQPDGTFNTAKDGSGDVVNAGDIIASMNNPNASTTDPMKLNNVGSSIADKAGNTFLDKIDAAAGDNNTKNGAVNVTDLKNAADAIGNKGLNFGAQSGDDIHKNLGEKLEIVGEGTKADDNYSASNIKTMTKDGKVVVALDKDLNGLNSIGVPGKNGVAGKDGVSISGKDGANGIDGKVSIGKDGKDAVSIAGKDGVGHIGLTGPKGADGSNGKSVDISTNDGKQTLVNPEAGTDKSQRIVYTPQDKDGNPIKGKDGKDIVREVATMDDGLKFTGNNTDTENKHALNTLVKVQGEGVTAAESATFKSAAGNINVVADGNDTLTVKLNKDLKGINSIRNSENGPALNFNAGDLSVTGGNLNMGGNKITNLGKGTDDSDAVNLKQLKDSRTIVKSTDGTVGVRESESTDGAKVYDLSTGASPRFDELTDEIGRVGAQGAALAALKPIQYDPLEPTQIMAGYGNYRGNSAIAMGVAHYKNESTMMHAGLAWAGGSRHMMANAGVTWKVGNRDSEAAVADRYRKGPISSAYAMQQEMASVKAQNAGLKTEVSDLKAENEQMKAQIAAMMAKLGM